MSQFRCPVCGGQSWALEQQHGGTSHGTFDGARFPVQDYMCLLCGHIGRYVCLLELNVLRMKRGLPVHVNEHVGPPIAASERRGTAIRPGLDAAEGARQSLTSAVPHQEPSYEAPIGPALIDRSRPLRRRPVNWFDMDTTTGKVVWMGIIVGLIVLIRVIFTRH